MKIETETSIAAFRRTRALHRRVTDAAIVRWKHVWVAVGTLELAWLIAIASHHGASAFTLTMLGYAACILLATGVCSMVLLAAGHAFAHGRPGRAALMMVAWPVSIRYTVRTAREIRASRSETVLSVPASRSSDAARAAGRRGSDRRER